MTDYSKTAARKTDEAKTLLARGFDKSVIETFAREAILSGRHPLILPREKIHAVGLFTLAAASLYFESLGVLNAPAEVDALEDINDSENPPSPVLSLAAEKALQSIRREMRLLSGAKGKALLSSLLAITGKASSGTLQRIKRERASFEIGTDGHPLTREVAANLNIARHFEGLSGDFALLITRVFAAITHYGVAYGAWERRLPLLICNLERASHIRAAIELSRIERGGVALLSEVIPNEVRVMFSSDAATNLTPFIEDKGGVFRNLIGIDQSDIFLVERRLGGWSITYPLGGVAREKLQNRRYPKWARALAACAPSLNEGDVLDAKDANYLRKSHNCERAGDSLKSSLRGSSIKAREGGNPRKKAEGKPSYAQENAKSPRRLQPLRARSPERGWEESS